MKGQNITLLTEFGNAWYVSAMEAKHGTGEPTRSEKDSMERKLGVLSRCAPPQEHCAEIDRSLAEHCR